MVCGRKDVLRSAILFMKSKLRLFLHLIRKYYENLFNRYDHLLQELRTLGLCSHLGRYAEAGCQRHDVINCHTSYTKCTYIRYWVDLVDELFPLNSSLLTFNEFGFTRTIFLHC